MLWLLIGCGEEILSEEPLSPPAEEPVVLGQEVQALWAPIEESHSKLSRIRFWHGIEMTTAPLTTIRNSSLSLTPMGPLRFQVGLECWRITLIQIEMAHWKMKSSLSCPYGPMWSHRHCSISSANWIPQNSNHSERLRLSDDLQDPEINGPLTWNKLCVIRTEEAPQSLWVPPNAGPIAEGCDLEVVNCHEPISIIEHIDNDGLAIDATEAEQLPDYPMSQPLESCFPGPSHYLDIEPNQPSAVTNPQDEHRIQVTKQPKFKEQKKTMRQNKMKAN